jgi:hypothetical protein
MFTGLLMFIIKVGNFLVSCSFRASVAFHVHRTCSFLMPTIDYNLQNEYFYLFIRIVFILVYYSAVQFSFMFVLLLLCQRHYLSLFQFSLLYVYIFYLLNI